MSLLSVQNLSVQGILSALTVTVNAGELVALVGPNGAGKTTLIQRLAGVQPCTVGQILFQQQSTQHWQAQDWAQHLSYLPQLSHVSFPLTVQEVVRLGGLAHDFRAEQLQRLVEDGLVHWDLTTLRQRDVRYLSGGEQQRVQLARSWLQMQADSCRVWLLDEPLAALDLRHQALCLKHVRALQRQGKTIIMVVHDLNVARLCTDRVWLMNQGQLVANGAARTVLNVEQVSQVFNLPIRLEGDYLHWW